MITHKQLIMLIQAHGKATRYIMTEGGHWKECSVGLTQAWSPGIVWIQAAHAITFKSGKVWDEVNGIRK